MLWAPDGSEIFEHNLADSGLSWKLRSLSPAPPPHPSHSPAVVLTTAFRNWSICPSGRFQPRGNWQRPALVPLRKIKEALLIENPGIWKQQNPGLLCWGPSWITGQSTDWMEKSFQVLNSAGTFLFFLLLKQCFLPKQKKPSLANQQLAFETAVRS